MAHRTRRRAVLRERREHAQERENVRLENIAIDKHLRLIRLEHQLLLRSEYTRSGRIRYDDLPDGPRVPGVFGEVVFARGIIMAQHMREWVRRDWVRFNEAAHGEPEEYETLYPIETRIRSYVVKVVDAPKEQATNEALDTAES